MNRKTTEIEIMLLQSDGFISGEDIAKSLGISRAAVWKHIDVLKKSGYNISSIPNRGYFLDGCQDVLSEVRIAQGLNVFKNITVLAKIDSTNSYLKKQAENGAPHGSVVLAREQTEGKGRLKRDWYSPKNSITMSLLLRTDIAPTQAPKLGIIAAIAVVDALTVYGLNCQIKWPNDIHCNGKKICGISLYMSADQDTLHYVVIGIGINVNESFFPDPICDIATSTLLQTGKTIDRSALVCTLLKCFEELYAAFGQNGFPQIMQKYRMVSCTLGQHVTVSGHVNVEGDVLDFDDDGWLVLRKNDGEIVKIMSGDVSLRGVK